MGAFFIFCKSLVHDVSPALELFKEMGFSLPLSVEVGEWTIYSYRKMVSNFPNVVSAHGCTLISTGTPIYKGLDYCDSLTALLNDYCSSSLDLKELIGQYTVLFCRKGTIDILIDPLGCKHLFTNKTRSMLSSHMLAIGLCCNKHLHINREAFCEKLLTGIIMPPSTLFREILQVDWNIAENINNECRGIRFYRASDFYVSISDRKTLEQCLIEQANTLNNYFCLLNKAGKGGIDIGLSGGYDSRLGLVCLNKFSSVRIHLHSHKTENVHNKDLAIARKMAKAINLPCHVIPTKELKHSDDVDKILRKSVLYFDGRSSFSIGGCGEVYTASYRKESTESTPFTLTGVGGELYRNVFDIGYRNIRFDRFMEDKVFSQNFRKALPPNLYYELHDSIIKKAAIRLGINPKSRQSKSIAHRFYCEIMMPDGQGVALDAYNQVSCCVAPFLEPRIIVKGYETIPFHHSGGEFEGKLIKYIDPDLAAIPSSYGYPIGKRSMTARIKESMRAYIPSSVWNQMAERFLRGKKSTSVIKDEELYAGSQTLKDACAYLFELFPEIDFIPLLKSKEDFRKIQFAAMTLYYMKEKIALDDRIY